MKKALMFLLGVVASVAMFAQSATVTGTVIDADSHEPLIGVSVLEVGTNNGIITDLDGNFRQRQSFSQICRVIRKSEYSLVLIPSSTLLTKVTRRYKAKPP